MGVAPRTPRDGLPEKEGEHPGGQVMGVCVAGGGALATKVAVQTKGGAAAADYLSSRGREKEGQHTLFGPELSTRTHRPAGTGNGGRTLTSVLSLYLGVGCCWLFRAADASLRCHLRSCQYDRSLQT